MAREDKKISDLFEKLLNDQLSESESAYLDEQLANSPEARKTYLEIANQNANLHYPGVSHFAIPTPDTTPPPKQVNWPIKRLIGTAAAVLILFSYLVGTRNTQKAIIAKMKINKPCSWGEGTLPTHEGAELTEGQISLLTGFATLEFTSGVTVNLEASANIQLNSLTQCTLLSGKILTKVPSNATGFIIDTAPATIIDRGTAFATLFNPENSTTVVEVFGGRVDVQQKTTQIVKSLAKGHSALISPDQLEVSTGKFANLYAETNQQLSFGADSIRIPVKENITINSAKTDPTISSHFLSVKNSIKTQTQHDRKSLLSFAIPELKNKEIKRSRLELQIVTAGKKFTTWPPDATFVIYGVTDETSDQWLPHEMNWNSFPACDPVSGKIQEGKAEVVGEIEFTRWQMNRIVAIEGDKLTDFLNRDSNQTASFFVVRKANSERYQGVAYGFASKTHPTAAPPSLLIETD